MIYTDGVHLVGDSLDELHSFTEKMGLNRCYYHGVRKGHPHYDLINKNRKPVYDKQGVEMRKKVVCNGAQVVDGRKILVISKSLNKNNMDLNKIAKEAIAKYPERVIEYKAGKTALIGLFVGEAMKISKGKADAKELNRTVIELLQEV